MTQHLILAVSTAEHRQFHFAFSPARLTFTNMDSFEKQVPPRRGRHTLWLLLGLAAGMAVGAAIDNVLLGILVGLGFAVALGSSLTQLRRVWRDHQERLHHGHR